MGLNVYTGGTFDLFHSGHVNFLRKCSQVGFVTVALNTDEFIADYKGRSPVMSFEQRKVVLEACVYVDNVIANKGGADSKPSILEVNPDIIIIGSDWARKDYYKQMQFDQDWLDQHGYGLAYIPYTSEISTTILKQRIRIE